MTVQMGVLKRLIVIDISKDKEKNPLFLVNPEIISKSKNTSIHEEGCLSLPGHFAEIERPAECRIKFVDYSGKKELKASGLWQLVSNMKLIILMVFYLLIICPN